MPVPVIVVFGPTAVGKTDFLLHFENIGEVISLDSQQVYRYLDIGTAKPDISITSRIPHHLIDCIDPDVEFSAGDFVTAADRLCRDIFNRGKIPLISGGTGFFLKNFIYGLPAAPPSDLAVRKELKSRCRNEGIEKLRSELRELDIKSWERIPANDSYRIIRALEVFHVSGGVPLSGFGTKSEPRSEYSFFLIGLFREREELYSRIDRRVDIMFKSGLAEEYKKLRKMGYGDDSPALSAIGYKEFSMMERLGSFTMAEIKDIIKKDSRNYAKRQITFFKSLSGVRWIHPDRWEEIREDAETFIREHSENRLKKK